MILDTNKRYLVLMPSSPSAHIYARDFKYTLESEGVSVISVALIPGITEVQFIEITFKEDSNVY